MLWTDVNEIAIELYESHPDVDPRYILFTELHNLVLGLEGLMMIQIKAMKKFWKLFK